MYAYPTKNFQTRYLKHTFFALKRAHIYLMARCTLFWFRITLLIFPDNHPHLAVILTRVFLTHKA